MIFAINKITDFFSNYWSGINLKTRFMALITLIISLVMSSLTFWALTVIQEDSIITDARFCKDLGVLFSSNLLDLLDSNDQQQLASFAEKIYLSTSSIRYILLFRVDGSLFFTLPVYSTKVHQLLRLHQNLFHFEKKDFLFGTPLVQYSKMFKDNITDIIIPLTKNGHNLGTLDLGINSNSTLSSSSHLISDLSAVIFISTWLFVIVSVILNTFTLNHSMSELLKGIKNIASGNFTQRLNIALDNELGDLIIGFNEMAERLEFYEKTNVDKLTSEKNKLETIVSVIADGIILVDTELRLLFVNYAAIKAFNWLNLNLIGQSICDYFPSHVNEALLPVLNNLIKFNCIDNLDLSAEDLCIRFDYNSHKVFRFLLTAVVDQNSDTLTGVALIVQDISREVKLNVAKNQFISNVSHELRTPLCNISSFLETLLDYNDSLNNYQKIEFLKIANNETRRLSSLVDDILDLSRLESEYNYQLKSVDIYRILNDVIQASKLRAVRANVNLFIELDSDIRFVLAHESSLLQVVANLISNAIKFTSCQSSIVIRVYSVPLITASTVSHSLSQRFTKLARIEIIDEGIGIDKRDQKHIFERFIRIENSIHTLKGTGLGLSIVRSILGKHNTKIIVQSQPFVGTNFSFDLIKID
uniref:Uncharacterized sensor-like histidine kinase ycf26 n=1 Tax=Rhodymenia pseudopalmata TaxID=31502 RepID=A0A1C9C7M8_RHOPU|nr:two component sensor kinase [Rhodymenia pseudopalmata]AOM64380.1 two component sensor kinase [Rhodymenia pseudopalmata]